MTYKEAMKYLTDTGAWNDYGFVTEEERNKVEKSMVIEAALKLKKARKEN